MRTENSAGSGCTRGIGWMRVFLRFPRISRRGGSTRKLRETPIHHEHFSKRSDHNVLGLKVAMNHAAGVRKADGLGDALHEAKFVGQTKSRGLLGKSLSLDIFHAVEGPSIDEHACIMNGDDARMLEMREDASLLQKAGGDIVCGHGKIENL